LELLSDDGSGNYRSEDSGTYIKANGTQILGSGTTLTSGLGSGTVACILRWTTGGRATVAQYREWNTRAASGSSSTPIFNSEKILANPTNQLPLVLPDNAQIGWTVKVTDYDGTISAIDYVRLLPSGSDTIMGAAFLDMDVPNDTIELTYNGAGDWRMT